MAIARTSDSPMCWATSQVMVVSPSRVRSTVRALLMAGISSGANSTSSTGPMIRTTRRCRLAAAGVPLVCDRGHVVSAPVALEGFRAPTISMISWVISACRAWLYSRVRSSISSEALSVAAFIARRRDACSEAAASSMAVNTRAPTYRGSRASSTAWALGS